MPALVAVCFNGDFKVKNEQLVGVGKAPKNAIAAVKHKIITLAKALL